MKPTRITVLKMFANITGVAAHAFSGFSVCRGGKKPQTNLRRLWWHTNATLHRLREWKSILSNLDVKEDCDIYSIFDMKKLIVSFVLLSLVTLIVPNSVNAAEGPCKTETICGHIVVHCDFFDYVTWQEIYCGGSVLDL